MTTESMLKELVDTLREEIAHAEERGYTCIDIEINDNEVELTLEGAKVLLEVLAPIGSKEE